MISDTGFMTNATSIEVGATYTHGNLYSPSHARVLALLSWEELTAANKERMTLVGMGHEDAYVALYDSRRVGNRYVLSARVFVATHYRSHEEMVAAYK